MQTAEYYKYHQPLILRKTSKFFGFASGESYEELEQNVKKYKACIKAGRVLVERKNRR